jgi:DNA-binding winged helix-turn-helix (wHTH) protein/dienelactone hydrolase
MPTPSPTGATIRFGPFELDTHTEEVRKHGMKLPLQPQAVRVLAVLAGRAGELVTREHLREHLWSADTFVDFDHSLHNSIARLREALGDNANHPRFIETLPRRGYRFIAPIEPSNATVAVAVQAENRPIAAPMAEVRQRPTRISPARVTVSIIFLIVVAVVGIRFWRRNSRVRWVRNVALPSIAMLAEKREFDAAYRVALEAQQFIPGDPMLLRLLGEFTISVSVQTEPPNGQIYVKSYSAVSEPWILLGRSRLQNVRVPFGYLRWKITHPGYETLEVASSSPPNLDLRFTLEPEGAAPREMVRVPGGTFLVRSAGPVQLQHYWLDKYEVTNRQFKEFVDRGGYKIRQYWQHEYADSGRLLSWEEAMDRFRDATGRPGPSTWELGTYPEDQADFPVGGVSWYEAAAYCESVGKSLPTVYHWYKAAGLGIASDILRFSNFDGKGPSQVGQRQGLGPYGTYDMAGNMKEWAWNAAGSKRYILGGGWNETSYMFAIQDLQLPISRAATFGFRCAQYPGALGAALTAPVPTLVRDYGKEKPVSETVFKLFRDRYTYDRAELDDRIESVDDSSQYWRKEKVTFNAAYGNERVIALLFLPKNAKPPYATVVFFPGVSSFFMRSSDQIATPSYEFIVRSGRAVLYPIYAGTYERGVKFVGRREKPEEVVQPGSACLPVTPRAATELVEHWAKDLGRSIDYLETRKDIDSHRLAFYGLSLGAVWGPVLTAIEPRLKSSVLVAGGLPFERLPSEIEPMNFAPRVKIPTLMVNGQQDFMYPVESSQIPLFRLLGVPPADKRHVLFDSGHVPHGTAVIKTILDWLDQYQTGR